MVIKKNRQTLMKETKMSTTLLLGNSLYKLQEIEDNSVDSIVTDPPYELGFMGKSWDNTGIAYNVELWRQCLRVLKPGGHLLAFGGTRTYHRMACAIEDAGFEVRDMIEWVYGSGFPKSRNIGKDMEKKEVGGIKNLKQIGTKQGIKVETGTQGFSYSKEYVAGKSMGGKQISGEIPVYEINNAWGGWGTALKPAHEPICMARKPLAEKTVAENCLKYGTGGINIDESRVDFVSEEDRKESTTKNQHADFGTKPMTNNNVYGDYSMIEPKNFNPTGRFPANLIHDNSDEVRESFPNSKAGKNKEEKGTGGIWSESSGLPCGPEYGDSGNASRFFKSIIYTAKASKKDRGDGNNHPTVKPVALMQYLIQMVTRQGGVVLDPFMGSGTTGKAARNLCLSFIGIEIEEQSFKIAESRINEPTLFN